MCTSRSISDMWWYPGVLQPARLCAACTTGTGIPSGAVVEFKRTWGHSLSAERAIHFTLVIAVSQRGQEGGLSCRRSDDSVEDPPARLVEANGRTRAPERARRGG